MYQHFLYVIVKYDVMNARIIISFIFIPIFLNGCNGLSSEDPYNYVYDLYKSEPKRVDIKHEEQDINTNHRALTILPSKNIAAKYNGNGFLSIINERLISVSYNRKTVKLRDKKSGEVSKVYENVGKGPGEYQSISQLITHDNKIYILDTGSGKIIELNEQLEYQGEFRIGDINLNSTLAIYDEILLYNSSKYEQFLIHKYSLESNSKIDSKLHPVIIPRGKQPIGYNEYKAHISPSGELLVASKHMPILFFYNDIESKYPSDLIRLQHDDLEMVNKKMETAPPVNSKALYNPPPQPIERNDKIIGLTTVFEDVHISTEWIFLVTSKNTLIVLSRNENKIQSYGIYRIFISTNNELNIRSIAFDHPFLYLSSPFTNNIAVLDITKL